MNVPFFSASSLAERIPATAGVALLAALFGTSDCLIAQRVQDTVLTTSGKRYRGVEVVSTSSTEVVFNQGDTPIPLPSRTVAEIEWHEPPEALALGRASAGKGRFTDAANFYAEAASNTSRDVLKAECLYFAAECMVRSALADATKAGEAAQSIQGWINDNSDNWRLPSARLWLGRAQSAAGDTEAAASTLQSLAEDVLKNNWPAIWGARAQFELAQAQMTAGRFAAARSTFRNAISAARSAASTGDKAAELVALEAQANVGIGDSMVGEGNFSAALEYFRDQANRSDNDAIKAAARAGEGQALFMEAEKTGDNVKLREAQLALAHASLLDSTGGDTSAKALYFSGRVLLALGAENQKGEYKQKAMEYFRSVVTTYSSSRWAGLAAQQMGR